MDNPEDARAASIIIEDQQPLFDFLVSAAEGLNQLSDIREGGGETSPEQIEKIGSVIAKAKDGLAKLHANENILIRAVHYIPVRRLEEAIWRFEKLV